MIDRFGFYFCDFPMRTNVQKQTQNYLYLSAPIAEASDKAELDSATKIMITCNDVDDTPICYATRKLVLPSCISELFAVSLSPKVAGGGAA